MDNKDNRLQYIDMTKGFGILLVILGHAYPVNNIRIWLHSFHMPLFFIISGCLFYYSDGLNKPMKYLFKSRTKGLLIPYIIFNTIFIFINYVLSGFTVDSLVNDISTVIRLNGIVALWFLPALFISELSFVILSKILKKDKLILLFVAFLFIISIIIARSYLGYIAILRSFIGIGFFAIGYHGFKYIKDLDIRWSLIIFFIIINILLSNFNGYVDLYQLQFNNILMYTACSLLGTFSTLLVFKKLNTIKLLVYLGQNTLIVMCTHQCIMSFFRIIAKNDLTGIISGFMLFILVACIEVPIIKIINRYLPFIIGKNYIKNKNIISDEKINSLI